MIVAINVAIGDEVRRGQQVAVVEAMKMEHVITASLGGIVRKVTMTVGDVVREGFPIVFVQETGAAGDIVQTEEKLNLDHIRNDLRESIERHALTLDENRSEAVARRRKNGYRMPRENIARLVLIDCPGIMVGPEVERTALVRHCTRLFNVGANLTTPLFSVVVRKAYGLGAQAMLGAGSLVGFFSIAWPTAEFAGMNIEGAVKLGYRRELMAIDDPEVRREEFDRRTVAAYESAKAVNAVTGGGIDDVIDLAVTRRWIVNSLKRLPPALTRTEKKYPYIDPW